MVVPKKIILDACNICQLKCPECENPKRTKDSVIGNSYLKFKDFKAFLKNNPFIKNIELSWSGEIFLNPELREIIKFAFKKRITLSAEGGVNLNSVSDETLRDIVKYKFSSIKVSIDGTSQETYSEYRKGGDLKTVLKNIMIINKYKREFCSLFPIMSWQFIIFGHNEHEIPRARQLAEKLGMQFLLQLPRNQNYSPVKNKAFVKGELQQEYATREEYLLMQGNDYMDEICKQLWKSPVINSDGNLFGCCWNHSESFGNVFESGLGNLLNSEKYVYMKKMLTGKVPPSDNNMCTKCSVFRNRNCKKIKNNIL